MNHVQRNSPCTNPSLPNDLHSFHGANLHLHRSSSSVYCFGLGSLIIIASLGSMGQNEKERYPLWNHPGQLTKPVFGKDRLSEAAPPEHYSQEFAPVGNIFLQSGQVRRFLGKFRENRQREMQENRAWIYGRSPPSVGWLPWRMTYNCIDMQMGVSLLAGRRWNWAVQIEIATWFSRKTS